MLLKWIGGILIIFGSTAVGFKIASNYRKEEKYMEQLITLLNYMECELKCRLTALPDLCYKVSAEAEGAFKKLFSTLANELENQISPDVYSCMLAAMSRCTHIPERIQICLQKLGKSLGKFDIDGQIRGLEAVRKECEYMLNGLRLNKDERLRSYQTLGICAGAGIAILFI